MRQLFMIPRTMVPQKNNFPTDSVAFQPRRNVPCSRLTIYYLFSSQAWSSIQHLCQWTINSWALWAIYLLVSDCSSLLDSKFCTGRKMTPSTLLGSQDAYVPRATIVVYSLSTHLLILYYANTTSSSSAFQLGTYRYLSSRSIFV